MKTVIIDTNIFVRYLTQDIKNLYQKSQEIFADIEKEKTQGLISILVINELVWILEKFYHMKRNTFIPPLLKILALKNIKIIETDRQILTYVLQSMQKYTFDFTDLYLMYLGKSHYIISFDKDFKKYE